MLQENPFKKLPPVPAQKMINTFVHSKSLETKVSWFLQGLASACEVLNMRVLVLDTFLG